MEMSESKPRVIVISGCNGAGKTTSSAALLRGPLAVDEFVNADAIAKGLSAFKPESVAIAAGRIMLDRLRELATARANFAFETTLASRAFAPWIAGLRNDGYAFHLFYYWLPSPQMAIARVQHRVTLGGHHVPAETINRRYYGGIRNFFDLYKPISDTWRWYNNAEPPYARLIASGGAGRRENVYRTEDWKIIEAQRKGPPEAQGPNA